MHKLKKSFYLLLAGSTIHTFTYGVPVNKRDTSAISALFANAGPNLHMKEGIRIAKTIDCENADANEIQSHITEDNAGAWTVLYSKFTRQGQAEFLYNLPKGSTKTPSVKISQDKFKTLVYLGGIVPTPLDFYLDNKDRSEKVKHFISRESYMFIDVHKKYFRPETIIDLKHYLSLGGFEDSSGKLIIEDSRAIPKVNADVQNKPARPAMNNSLLDALRSGVQLNQTSRPNRRDRANQDTTSMSRDQMKKFLSNMSSAQSGAIKKMKKNNKSKKKNNFKPSEPEINIQDALDDPNKAFAQLSNYALMLIAQEKEDIKYCPRITSTQFKSLVKSGLMPSASDIANTRDPMQKDIEYFIKNTKQFANNNIRKFYSQLTRDKIREVKKIIKSNDRKLFNVISNLRGNNQKKSDDIFPPAAELEPMESKECGYHVDIEHPLPRSNDRKLFNAISDLGGDDIKQSDDTLIVVGVPGATDEKEFTESKGCGYPLDTEQPATEVKKILKRKIERLDERKSKKRKKIILQELPHVTGNKRRKKSLFDNPELVEQKSPVLNVKTPANSDIVRDGRRVSDLSIDLVQDDISAALDTRGSMVEASVAAGDDEVGAAGNEKSIWLRSLYAASTQNLQGSNSTVKGRVVASSAGFDFETENGLLLGGAYSYASSRYKYKQVDHAKIYSNVFSIYAQKQCGGVVMRAIVSYSDGRAQTRDKAQSEDATIYGNFSNKSYAAWARIGGRIYRGGLEIMPFIGFGYLRGIKGAYKETGHSDPKNNLSYGKASSDELNIKAGVRVSKYLQLDSGSLLIPHINISAQHDLKSRNDAISAWLDSGEMVSFSSNSQEDFSRAKFAFGAGAGLTYRSRAIELSASYASSFRQGYKTHQGSLKLKIFI